MKAKREMEPALSHPSEHSNRPTPFPGKGPQRMIPRRSGWDPYEVWQTRVKAPRDRADEETLDPVG